MNRMCRRRCTRLLSLLLALTVPATPMAAAASPPLRVIAAVPAGAMGPVAEADWARALSALEAEPLVMLMPRDEVAAELGQRNERETSLAGAAKAAGLAHRGRVRKALDAAWERYYRLELDSALTELAGVDESLRMVADPQALTSLLFEKHLLAGMVHRASGNAASENEFMLAAAVGGSRDLPPDRYSPDIIAAYNHARRRAAGSRASSVSVKVHPPDATVVIDGAAVPSAEGVHRAEILPGEHVLWVSAPGYRGHLETFDAGDWQEKAFSIDMEPGPISGRFGDYYIDRLMAGDRAALARLASALDSDGLLLAGVREGTLKAWVVDGEGRAVGSAVISGEGAADPAAAMTALMAPFRIPLIKIAAGDEPYEALAVAQPRPPEIAEPKHGLSRWWYLLGGVALLAIISGGGDGGSGGTTVVATW